KKYRLFLSLLLTVFTLVCGLVATSPQTAEAKTYTIPKSVRGTWYAFNTSTYKYNKVHITKHGEYHSGYYYKQRGKAKVQKFGGVKYYQLWTSVNPVGVRASKGKFMGKKRAVLYIASQGVVTAYFHKHIRLTYRYLF
ncbi:hypothetical protein D1831_13675, partial [Lactiplantibacillus garii]